MKIVFMGTPNFAAVQLDALAKSEHHIVLVISQPDAKKDRGKKEKPTAVKMAAKTLGLDVIQPHNVCDIDVIENVAAVDPDVCVVAAYGQKLSREFLDIPKFGCLNIHASLLPKYRGASPMQHAILAGEEITGVTIMQMSEGMDTGDMIAKREIKIAGKNLEELHDELAKVGADLILKVLRDIERGSIDPQPQDESLASWAPLIDKKDGKIDFCNDAAYIERQIRAFSPWPGAYTYRNGEIFKVWQAKVVGDDASQPPGTISGVDEEGISVATGKGQLVMQVVQRQGKKRMDTRDFVRGNNIEIGEVLG